MKSRDLLVTPQAAGVGAQLWAPGILDLSVCPSLSTTWPQCAGHGSVCMATTWLRQGAFLAVDTGLTGQEGGMGGVGRGTPEAPGPGAMLLPLGSPNRGPG